MAWQSPVCASRFSGSNIIYCGLGAAQETQESFDQLWTQVIGGPAYEFVSKTAGTLAAIFVIAWVVRHQKDLDGGAEHLRGCIRPRTSRTHTSS